MRKIIFLLTPIVVAFFVSVFGEPVCAEDPAPTEGESAPASTDTKADTAKPNPQAEAEAKKQENKRLTPGVLSSFNRSERSEAVDTASSPTQGDEPSPVSGSISYAKNGCVARVTNTDKKSSYSVSFDVIGTNKQGSTALKRSFSASLKPEETVTHTVSCSKDLNMQVVLKSGRKVK